MSSTLQNKWNHNKITFLKKRYKKAPSIRAQRTPLKIISCTNQKNEYKIYILLYKSNDIWKCANYEKGFSYELHLFLYYSLVNFTLLNMWIDYKIIFLQTRTQNFLLYKSSDIWKGTNYKNGFSYELLHLFLHYYSLAGIYNLPLTLCYVCL